jgi:hypothetical protein
MIKICLSRHEIEQAVNFLLIHNVITRKVSSRGLYTGKISAKVSIAYLRREGRLAVTVLVTAER